MLQHGKFLMRRTIVPLRVEATEPMRRQIPTGDLPIGTSLPSINLLGDAMTRAKKMKAPRGTVTLEERGTIQHQSARGLPTPVTVARNDGPALMPRAFSPTHKSLSY